MKNNYILKGGKNVNQFTEDGIIDAINNINKQITYIKSIYNVKNAGIHQNSQLSNIQDSIQNIVEAIEPVENIKQIKNDVYKFISIVEDNDTLLISEKEGKVFLPYTVKDLNAYLVEYPDEYKSLSDVVNQEYIISMDEYKNQSISRFKEMYSLMRDVEMKSIIESFKKAFEIMFDTRVNPAIIAACRSEEQIKNYVHCLERNDLSSFKDFKIVFDMAPLTSSYGQEFDWEGNINKSGNIKRKGKRYK